MLGVLERVRLSKLLRQHKDWPLDEDELITADINLLLGEGEGPQSSNGDTLRGRGSDTGASQPALALTHLLLHHLPHNESRHRFPNTHCVCKEGGWHMKALITGPFLRSVDVRHTRSLGKPVSEP